MSWKHPKWPQFDLQLHGAAKAPTRQIDGPFAQFAIQEEDCQIILANNGTLKLGQPVALDVTKLGPDANVPNNASALPLCEQVVAITSANAGPVFGVISGIKAPVALPGGSNLVLSYVNGFSGATVSGGGIPTWTNKTGGNLTVTIKVVQQGFAYVWAGTAAIGQQGGHSILVGSQLIVGAQPSATNAFAVQGTAAIQQTIGVAIATAVNTFQQQPGGPTAAGVVSVLLNSMVGVVPPVGLFIDTLGSGVQEAVSVGSISYPTASIALANAHSAGVRVTGPNAGNAGINTVLISTPGAGVTVNGLVAAWVELG